MNTVTDNLPIREQLNLPPLDQVGFVVPDIEQAILAYSPLFGPWQRMDAEINDADFRGCPCDCKIKLAFGKSGELEIELIEIVEGESPHSEFIARGGNGMHHLRFRTPDIEEKIADAQQVGYEPIWYKKLDEDTCFCYLERPGDPLIIEFLKMS